jgi:transposase
MPYSSSLTDKEWAIIEPLLPQKKQTRPPKWTKRQILDGIFYQLKNGCNWCDLPCIFTALQGRCFGISLQWREAGVIEQMMTTLHGKVRADAKKNQNGQPY